MSNSPIVWITDPHLNFVEPPQVDAFLESIREREPEAVLLGGDIAEATDVVQYLELLAERLPCPIYFVLGNHDYYFGSIAAVRDQVQGVCARLANLHYLTGGEVHPLRPDCGLLGHDGWADARLGDYERSYVMMNDYRLIDELAGVRKMERKPLLEHLADEAAAQIDRQLRASVSRFARLILLTHVPPFREACWHEGEISDNEWLPHFTCKAMGDAILDVMRDHPDCDLTVLCGHTHSGGESHPLSNVRVRTGGAKYGAPSITGMVE